jgi:hypothetical protein
MVLTASTAAAAALLAAGFAQLAQASVWTGNGPDNNWSTAANWDVAAGPGSPLVFDGANRLTPFNDFGAGTAFGGISFNSTAGAFTISGNDLVIGGDLTDNATTPQTINLNIGLDADRVVTVAPGGMLTLGGVVSGGFGARVMGGGALVFGANNTYTGPTTIDGATVSYAVDNTGVQTLSFGQTPAAGFASTATGTLNVNANVTATALTVQTNNATADAISIAPGKTLTVNGPVTVGLNNAFTNGQASTDPQAITNATVTGAGSSFIVNGGASNFLVGVNRSNTPTNPDPATTLDLSGISTFSLNTTGELRVGFGGNIAGTLTLASSSNLINAGTVQVGNSNNQNNAGASRILLGPGSNVINTGLINMGGGKTAGSIAFQNSSGTLSIDGTTPGAGANGVFGAAGSATASNTVSQFFVNGHFVNLNFGSLTLGRLSGSTSGGIGAAQVQFDTGTFTVGTLQFALDQAGTAPNGTVGTFNLGTDATSTGVLNVGTALIMGNNTNAGTGTATPARAALNIAGGIANVGGDITVVNTSAVGSTTATISLSGGTLNMTGHAIFVIQNTGTVSTTLNTPPAGQTATIANLGGIGVGGAGLTVNGGGTLQLAGNSAHSEPSTVTSGTLSVLNNGLIGSGTLTANGGNVVFQSGNPLAQKVAAVSIASGNTVDLNDNDMIVGNGTSKADVTAAIRSARNGGSWDGSGLTSTEARNRPAHNTTLGVLSGAEYTSVGGTGTFSGQSYADTDTLVKYTYYGDTDFNGKINFDDYVRTDNGFNNHLTGWLNGDFDHSGTVNFDDYVLIDLAFNTQSGTLGRALSFLDGSDRSAAGMNGAALQRVKQDFEQFGDGFARGFLSAVPEPASLALIVALVAPALISRRRRDHNSN